MLDTGRTVGLAMVVAGGLSLSGCATPVKGGPGPSEIATIYDAVQAGFNVDSKGQARASPLSVPEYISSGLQTVDTHCDLFFDRLGLLNQRVSMSQGAVNLLGGTTAGVLAATNAHAKAISIVALGFAGADAQIKNYKDYELLSPYAQSLSVMIRAKRKAFREQAWPDERMGASDFVRAYAGLCTVDSIRSDIQTLISNAKADVDTSGAPQIAPAERLALNVLFPDLHLDTLSDERLARLYWFLTDGSGTSANQLKQEFADQNDLLNSEKDTTKPISLTEKARKLLVSLNSLKVRDHAFAALVSKVQAAYVAAQAQADKEAKDAAKKEAEALTGSDKVKALNTAAAQQAARVALPPTGAVASSPPLVTVK